MTKMTSWFNAPPNDPRPGLNLVRIVVAIVLLTHPLYLLFHPGEFHIFGQFLATHGIPGCDATAGGITLLQIASSLALLSTPVIVWGCLGQILVLTAAIWLVHAPWWYALGGTSVGHRGMEYNVLLIACLTSILWSYWHNEKSTLPTARALRGLDIIRIAAAIIISTHPLHGIFHPIGLHGFGEELKSNHFPLGGVPLVWFLMFWQITCSVLLLLRRFVVPAAIGHIFVLCIGIWYVHWPLWFVVGQGEGGMEYSVVLIACFLSTLLTYWPRKHSPLTNPAHTTQSQPA